MRLFGFGMDGCVYSAAATGPTGPWFQSTPVTPWTWTDWEKVSTLTGLSSSGLAATYAPGGTCFVAATGMGGLQAASLPNAGTGHSTWSAASSMAGGAMKATTPLTAFRDPQSGWSAFAGIGEDQRAYVLYCDGELAGSWLPIGTMKFDFSTPLTAVVPDSLTVQLVAVGPDGRVYEASTKAMGATATWTDWEPTSTNTFPQDTHVGAVAVEDGWLDLFAIGGAEAYTAWQHGGAWQGFTEVGGGAFTSGTPITAVATYLLDEPAWIDLFAVGEDGRAYNCRWRGTAWSSWQVIDDGGFNQKTPITAAWSGSGQLHLFAVGTDGRLYTTIRTPVVYDFNLSQVHCDEQRSRPLESDTVYTSFGVQVVNGAGSSAKACIGESIHTGDTVSVSSLNLSNVEVNDNDVVIVTYSAVNSGGTPSALLTAIEQQTVNFVDAGVKADIVAINDYTGVDLSGLTGQEQGAVLGAQLGTIALPGIGTWLGAVAGFFAGDLWSILTGNCDGPVASSFFVFSGAQLRTMTNPANSLSGYSQTDHCTGVPSSTCGATSEYDFSWKVSVTGFPSALQLG